MGEGEKILLVDDEPNVLESIQRQLRNRFEVMTAQSGEEALVPPTTVQEPLALIW